MLKIGDKYMCEYYFEEVEVCPFCDSENTYPMWDVDEKCFVAKCQYCGEEIFLCDACQHYPDNSNEIPCCNWTKTKSGGSCYRGVTINSSKWCD